ncbi:MAG: NAD(P)H-dependent oxidoreductase subunit E [Acidobacteriota bacterium]
MEKDSMDQIIDKYQGNPGALIHVLMEIQSKNHWLPKEALEKVSRKLGVPLSRVLQIVTFYKTFSLVPKGRHEIHICTGTSCYLRGSQALVKKVRELTGIRPGETDSDSRFSLETGSCQGCCTLGPEIIVDGNHHGRMKPDRVEAVLKNYE